MTRPRLLCIDLQIGDGLLAAPDARAVFGARQLIAIARRDGWAVVHTRMRGEGPAGGGERHGAPIPHVRRT